MVQSLENEIWAAVVGYEGIYEVSNVGRIKTLSRENKVFGNGVILKIKERIKSFNLTHGGYHRVQLSKDGVNKGQPLHRLVLAAFKGFDKERPFVNHINGVKTDNRLENLEWCTHTENIRHSFSKLGRKMAPGMSKKGKENHLYGKGHLKSTCKKIYCSTLGVEFPSIRQAARELNLSDGFIGQHLKNGTTHVKGFVFRYI